MDIWVGTIHREGYKDHAKLKLLISKIFSYGQNDLTSLLHYSTDSYHHFMYFNDSFGRLN